MPHQSAHSPRKSKSSSLDNTPSSKATVTFSYDVKTFTPTKTPANRLTMLWDAILKDDVKQVAKIVKSSELIRGLIVSYLGKEFSEDHHGENALTLAVKLRRHKIVEILVKAVGWTELTNVKGYTALHIAVKNQDYVTTSVLLQKSAAPKVSSKIYFDVLKLAHKKSLAARSAKACEVAKNIEAQLLEYGYDNNELKFCLKDVSGAKREKRVKKLESQNKDPTKYLSKVYVRKN